jgi:hypothetical protein
MAAMPKAYDLACVIHVHSTHSDGTGTIPEIAAAAAGAGVDVVLLTDHDTLEGRRRGEERWYGDVLVLIGEEVTPTDRDHYLAFGVEREVTRRPAGPEIAKAVRAQGGFGFAAHPFSTGNARFKRPGVVWETLDEADGVELWSFVSDAGERVKGVADVWRMLRRPERFIGNPPERNLRAWAAVCEERRLVAVGGLDAHQFGIRVAGRVPLRLMSYGRSFLQLRTHVLLDDPPSGDLERDRAAVYGALREGRCFLGVDTLAPSRGFMFWADDGPMGAELPAGVPRELHVRLPRPATIRVLRGTEVIATSPGDALDLPASDAGVYRVEVDIGDRTWIVSNPVYVREPT